MTHKRFPADVAFLAVFSAVVLSGCLDASDDAPGTNLDNTAPVANAGPDQADVPTSTLVTLDGSGSSDADGDSLEYQWEFVSQPAGSAVTLSGAAGVAPTFTPQVAGAYSVRLTVDDSFGSGTSSDEVSIVAVVPQTNPPVAAAGPDQDIGFASPGGTVNLSGAGSSDPDGDPLSYDWEIIAFVPSGPLPPVTNVTLIGADTATPSFDVTDLEQLGEYTIRLTVSDGTLQSTDDVVVTVAKSFPAARLLFGSGIFAGIAMAWTNRRRNRARAARPGVAGTEGQP